MLYISYTLLLIYIININFISNGLKIRFIHELRYGFLIPKARLCSKLQFYSLNEESIDENKDSQNNIDLNKYLEQDDENDEFNYEDYLNKLGLNQIEHVELSEQDNLELQKILDKHIELHKDEFKCSETQGNVEILKKKIPKKFDINSSDDEFDVENYNGKFPDEEEIENYLDPLNLRNRAPKEEFAKRMVGRTYNLYNIPDEKYETHCIDQARRFLYYLPLNQWNNNEKSILDEFIKRKIIKEQSDTELMFVDFISPDELLNSPPSSPIGLKMSDKKDNCEEKTYTNNNVDIVTFNSIVSVPHHIIEYTHYDLLSDLREFKQHNMNIENINLDKPLFVRMDEEKAIKDDYNKKSSYLKLLPISDSLSVYSVWPSFTLDSPIPGGEYTEIEDNYIYNTLDPSYKSYKTDKIPYDGKYRSGIIILEDELGGANDHRIRDYADELSCITKFPVFIPQISDYNKSYEILDRLIKNIQILYKIERISIVSFGKSSRLSLDYCYDRLGGKEYLNTSRGVLTLYEITNRTSFPLNIKIFNSSDFYDKLHDERDVIRAKRLNPVRPIKDILQCLVFLDSRNVNIDKSLSLGLPLLNVISGNPNVNSHGDELGFDMLKNWKNIKDLGYKVNCEDAEGFDIFTILRPKGKVVYRSNFDGNQDEEDTKDNIENMGTAFKTARFKNKNTPIYLLEDDKEKVLIFTLNFNL